MERVASDEDQRAARDERLLAICVELATRAHDGQVDRSGHPYIGHPMRVMARVRDPRAKMAAVLHDVLEDSALTSSDLLDRGVPDDVIAAVETLSKRAGESYEAFVQRIAVSGDPIALQIKRADIADNSDPARLAQLDEETRDRLAAKYRRGLEILDGSDR